MLMYFILIQKKNVVLGLLLFIIVHQGHSSSSLLLFNTFAVTEHNLLYFRVCKSNHW